MRWFALVTVLLAALAAPASAGPTAIRCDNLSTADLAVDGLLDDWPGQVLTRVGVPSDGSVALRCSWDGTALAIALDVTDDRVVRLASPGGQQDHVTITVGAGGKPVVVDVFPGNTMAKAKITKPAKVAVADSLQPKGFSVEMKVPAKQLAGLTASTPALSLQVTFTDSDKAAGGDTIPITIDASIELGDRKDLLDDFLRTVRLKRSDLKLDTLADLDPDRRGNERLVAGGTVIGVLTDQFAYVSLPVAQPADVRKIELLPFGARGTKVVSAVARQSGNGGSRDLLMLWTVWSGQLQPLAQIEIRKEQGGNLLESSYKLVKGKKGTELWVEPKPAVGFTEDTWNEQPADDADAIVLPWDTTRSGVAYSVNGAEIERRDLPAPKKKR
jgi:hypothetical protein